MMRKKISKKTKYINDFYNLKLYETRNIVENTILEFKQKYGADCL